MNTERDIKKGREFESKTREKDREKDNKNRCSKKMYTEREISRKAESLRVRQEKKTERKII